MNPKELLSWLNRIGTDSPPPQGPEFILKQLLEQLESEKQEPTEPTPLTDFLSSAVEQIDHPADPWDISHLTPRDASPGIDKSTDGDPLAATFSKIDIPIAANRDINASDPAHMAAEIAERHRIATELAERYGVADPHAVFAQYANPHETILLGIAEEYMEQLRARVPECEVCLGGSLGSGTMLPNTRDVDLRLLAPKGFESETTLKAFSEKVEDLIPYVRTMRNKPDAPVIVFHDKHITHPDVDGEISISLNIQRGGEGYYNMAGKVRELPLEQRQRLVIAKGRSKPKGDAEYRRVKEHWKGLIYWLNDHGYYEDEDPNRRQGLLDQAQFLFPLFFTHPRPSESPA